MQTESRPFTPYDPTTRHSKLVWLVLGGVVAVGAIVWLGRREPSKDKPQVMASGNVAPQFADGKALQKDAVKLVDDTKAALAPLVKSLDSGPNVLGAQAARGPSVATASLVPSSEVERQKARARRAESQEAKARREVVELRRANAELGQRLAQMQIARRPPPPTQSEQILETLAPALRSADER